jgi:hypothetical protein
MPAKNKRRITGADLHSDLLAHMEAYRRAEEWAQKCLDLRAASKAREAAACENKAKHWLARALRIEGRHGQA